MKVQLVFSLITSNDNSIVKAMTCVLEIIFFLCRHE